MLKKLIMCMAKVFLLAGACLSFSWSVDEAAFDPYKPGHIQQWAVGARLMETYLIKDYVSAEYADRIDETPLFDESRRFLGYKYSPCALFDGEALLSCVEHRGSGSRVLCYEGLRAGNLPWKLALTGIGEVISVDLRYVWEDPMDFLDEDTQVAVGKFSLESDKKEKPSGLDLIIAPHMIDGMEGETLVSFLKTCFDQLKDGGRLHLLWKYFQNPLSCDFDYQESFNRRLYEYNLEIVTDILEPMGFLTKKVIYVGDTLANPLDKNALPENYFISISAEKNPRL